MENKLRIGFTGDLSFSGFFKGAHLDNELMSDEIKGFLSSNDYNVINFESPITPCKVTKKKRLAHRCDPETLDFVRENIKNPIVSFANNHMMDYSRIGMIDSIDSVEQWGLPYIGAGRNVEDAVRYVILGDKVKVGIFAVQYKKYKIATEIGCGPMHESRTDLIKATINKLKGQVDYVVMVYHGGDEFFHAPMPYIRKQLKGYLNWGCDVVVAHHPHVVQGYEILGQKAVFYSLGNFIFDTAYQRAQEDTDKGMLLSLTFDAQGFTFDSQATLIDRESRKILAREYDEYFHDLKNMKYSKLWCTEAYRKADFLKRAADLKANELTTAEEEREREQKIVDEIYEKAMLKKHKVASVDELYSNDPDDEQEEEQDEDQKLVKTVSKKVKLKKIYRKIFVDAQKNRRTFVVKYGAFKAKLLYKSSL